MLKPETSSDSPSEKSKGERLDSAKQENNQQIKMIKNVIKNATPYLKKKFSEKPKTYQIKIIISRLNNSTTSYETL